MKTASRIPRESLSRQILLLSSISLLALGSIIASAGPTIAQTIYVSRNEMGPYGRNFYTGGALGDYPSDYNGQMIITANVGSGLALPASTQYIWCIDQLGYIGLGDNPNIGNNSGIVYDVGSLSDFTTTTVPGGGIIMTTSRQAQQIAALAYIGDGLLSGSLVNFPVDLSGYTNNEVGNAIQAAITNIQYGTTSDGGTEVNMVTTQLMDWASLLSDAELSPYRANIYTAISGEQRIINAYVLVPAPLPLLGVGAAFGYSRKLRKRIKISKTPEVMSAIG